jgi:hypothetical protein
MLSESVLGRERGHKTGSGVLPYNVQFSVFVNDVESLKNSKLVTDPLQLIIPSYVRLEPCDCAPVSEAEGTNPALSVNGIRRAGNPRDDRELSVASYGIGDAASEVPEVQLIHEVIESTSGIEQNVPSDKRQRGLELWDLSDKKAVLASIVVRLCTRDSVIVERAPVEVGNFALKGGEVGTCPTQLGEGTVETAFHKLHLIADIAWRLNAKDERGSPDTGDSAQRGRASGDSDPDTGRGLS